MNTGPDARYVGSERCAECHADQHASYLMTAHSRSMSRVDPAGQPPDATLDHAASGRRYEVLRSGGALHHRESLVLADGGELELADYPLSYLVGSGRFARTYLVEDAGFLVESPLTWYASLQQWAMSPGYDRAEHRSFQRTIGDDCLYCHAGAVERIQGNDQRLNMVETAISCERCHGPGSLHVARWAQGTDEPGPAGDPTIVNPRRLPRELAEAVCHQCHLTSEVQVAVRGRRASDFRPGLRWQDFAIDYGHSAAPSEMTVVGHVEQMRQSRCYQASGSLTCLTCHPAHAPVAAAQRASHFRATCVQCHVDPSCSLPLLERTSRNQNDCAACHMPQTPTDVPHVAFTHHRVGIHEPQSSKPKVAATGFLPLAPVLDVSLLSELDRQYAQGLANLQYYRDHQQQPGAVRYLKEARPLVEATLAAGLVDGRLALAKAELAGAAGDLPLAEHWARLTLAEAELSTTDRAAALRLLAAFDLQDDRLPEAKDSLEQLTALRRDPRDWLLLGVCQQRLGNAAAAVTALERVLQIDPAPPETYELLEPLYRAQGLAERAAWCRQRAGLIRQTQRAE
ncbi:MAG: multiheme c-type cytochrome [Pirellulaceae bacterium]